MDIIDRASQILHAADALCITAGAGMGVDSGLPDFRGNEGFWNAYPPMRKAGISFVEMANPEWFEQNPQLAWGFYGHRLNLYRQTDPHQGYLKLLEICRKKAGGCFIFTSNVDGHFQKAGFSEDSIVECHGSINYWQCTLPCCDAIWPAPISNIAVDEMNFLAEEPLPQCPHCRRTARPNVLMFNDWHWIGLRTKHQNQRFVLWTDDIKAKGYQLVIIEIGAGEAVPTVRIMSETLAATAGAILIRINPRDHQVPPGHIGLAYTAMAGIQILTEKICD